jgi:cytochrome c oxidase subunit 1
MCVKSGKPVKVNKAWEGAHGLEWELPSPAPYHSWQTPPSDAIIAKGAFH